MRGVLTVLLATLVLTLPLSADYRAISQSVRALQAPKVDEFGIRTLQNTCTVTSINERQHYWLTAAHCVDSPELYVASRQADVVFVDKAADLVVLHTEGYSLPALKLRSTQPTVDQHVMMVGHPVGLPQVQVFHGRISSLRTEVEGTDMMLFDLTACGGNSGSAVVDDQGHVLSVLQIGFTRGCGTFSGGVLWNVLARLVGPYFG